MPITRVHRRTVKATGTSSKAKLGCNGIPASGRGKGKAGNWPPFPQSGRGKGKGTNFGDLTKSGRGKGKTFPGITRRTVKSIEKPDGGSF